MRKHPASPMFAKAAAAYRPALHHWQESVLVVAAWGERGVQEGGESAGAVILSYNYIKGFVDANKRA